VLATLGVCIAIAPIAALQLVPRTENREIESAVLALDEAEPDLAWLLVASSEGKPLTTDTGLRRATAPLTGRFRSTDGSLVPLFDAVTPPGWRWAQSDTILRVSASETQADSFFEELRRSLRGEMLATHPDGVTGILYLPGQPSRNRALLWAGSLPHIVRVGEQLDGYGEVQRISEEGVQLTSESGMLFWELRVRGERSDE
jgi:hypothetical protein